jgi:hypothetical protein
MLIEISALEAKFTGSKYREFYNQVSYDTTVKLCSVLLDACKFGHLDIVQWLEYTSSFCQYELKVAFSSACEHNQLDVAKWLAAHKYMNKNIAMSNSNAVFSKACQNGHFDLVKWLTIKFKITRMDVFMDEKFALLCTCIGGHLTILQWLIEHFGLNVVDFTINECESIRAACRNGHLEIVRFLVGRYFAVVDFSDEVRRELLEDVDYRYDNVEDLFRDFYNINIFTVACINNQLEIAKYLAGIFNLTSRDMVTKNVLYRALKSNADSVDAVQWLSDNFDLFIEPNTPISLFEQVCSGDNLLSVRWVADRYSITTEDVREHNIFRRVCRSPSFDTKSTRDIAQYLADRFELTYEDAYDGDDRFAGVIFGRVEHLGPKFAGKQQ